MLRTLLNNAVIVTTQGQKEAAPVQPSGRYSAELHRDSSNRGAAESRNMEQPGHIVRGLHQRGLTRSVIRILAARCSLYTKQEGFQRDMRKVEQ